MSLAIVKTFVSTVGSAIPEASDLLHAVATLKIKKESYSIWISCIAAFL